MKGVHINWGNNVFQIYKYNSAPILSKKILTRAIYIVIKIFDEERNKIEKAFSDLARKRYRGKVINIDFDYETVYRRVYSTKISSENEYCYGESDENQIWICRNKVPYDILVGTILHEALHYFAYFNGKEICEKDEHYVMRQLGDDC